MNRYDPVGRCIYCGATSYGADNSRPLADEHIIPLALDGDRVLPNASCQRCEKLTSSAELMALRGVLRGPRISLALKSRKGHPDTLPLFGHHQGSVFKVDIDAASYPSILLLPAPAWLPAMLTGYDLPETPRMFVYGGPLNEHASRFLLSKTQRTRSKAKKKNWKKRRRQKQLQPMQVQFSDAPPEKVFHGSGVFSPSLNVKLYYRMLAKVAHAYAVAELGLDSFKPFLLDVIQGIADDNLGLYFGGPLVHSTQLGTLGHLHSVSLHFECSFDEVCYIVARIKLFDSLGGPPNYVVVGELFIERLSLSLREMLPAEQLRRRW